MVAVRSWWSRRTAFFLGENERMERLFTVRTQCSTEEEVLKSQVVIDSEAKEQVMDKEGEDFQKQRVVRRSRCLFVVYWMTCFVLEIRSPRRYQV